MPRTSESPTKPRWTGRVSLWTLESVELRPHSSARPLQRSVRKRRAIDECKRYFEFSINETRQRK